MRNAFTRLARKNVESMGAAPSAATWMPKEEWTKRFEESVANDPYKEQPIIAMEIICDSIRMDDSKTLQETLARMKFVRDVLSTCPSAGVAVVSSGELFTRFITRSHLEIDCAESIDAIREILTRRGDDLINTMKGSHKLVSKYATPLLEMLYLNFSSRFPDTINVLTQGWSKSICTSLIDAHKQGFSMNVMVMECRPRRQGLHMCRELRKGGVVANVFPDTSLSYFMERTSFVFVAAEALTMTGAVIGEAGFSNIAHMAKAMSKNVYVTAEVYRFVSVRYCNNPMVSSPSDFAIPVDETDEETFIKRDGSTNKINHDYTHQKLIEYILTDVGPMSPAQVKDITNSILI